MAENPDLTVHVEVVHKDGRQKILEENLKQYLETILNRAFAIEVNALHEGNLYIADLARSICEEATSAQWDLDRMSAGQKKEKRINPT